MTQVRAIAAMAVAGLMMAMPAAAHDGAGPRGVTTTTHGSPNRGPNTSTGKGTGSTATRGRSGAEDHGRPDGDHARHDGDHDRRSGAVTSATTGTNTALAAKLSQHPNQLARIQSMLPAGMTLEQATAGFRNQGQFIAALNASKNQGVSFADLQKAMTVDGLSLGQAVRKLKPPTTTTTTTTESAS